jgi:hypothetical protein
VKSLRSPEATSRVLLRADSAFYGHATIGAAVHTGAAVSVTVRVDPRVRAAIAAIPDDGWTPIEYTDAVYDDRSGRWVSRSEVAEGPFTAFASRKNLVGCFRPQSISPLSTGHHIDDKMPEVDSPAGWSSPRAARQGAGLWRSGTDLADSQPGQGGIRTSRDLSCPRGRGRC